MKKYFFIGSGNSLQENIPTEKNIDVDNLNDISADNKESSSSNNYHCNISNHSTDGSENSLKNISYAQENERLGFDLGLLTEEVPTSKNVEVIVKEGPRKFPSDLPSDGIRPFPTSVLCCKRNNGETVQRDWLVWSNTKESLHCFPCRLFDEHSKSKSVLTSCDGWNKGSGWRKLYNKLPTHESSAIHRLCYVKWRETERRILECQDIGNQIDNELRSGHSYWKDLFKRLLSITLFLSERGLPFRGTSSKIGVPNNGNFLGLAELLGEYDPILREHLTKVKESQNTGQRLQAHYLSPESQNEFILACQAKVLGYILEERRMAKYFALIVDATPDVSHVEQNTFIIRYLHFNNQKYFIKERFLGFEECNKKTGEDIKNLILEKLLRHNIPLKDCRAQCYDNGSNMAGKFKGAQAHIQKENPLAKFSICGAHSLNLCGVNAAECCEVVITFFGVVQKLYCFFSQSPQRWEILQSETGCSLHKMSDTRWSARVDSIKPIAKHLPLIKRALEKCKNLSLTAIGKVELNGLMRYCQSFNFIILSIVWYRILVPIDQKNKVLQAREATLDVEVESIDSLIEELKEVRCQWQNILSEAKIVANNILKDMPTETKFPEKRIKKRKRFEDESDDAFNEFSVLEDECFKINVFYKILDSVIGSLTERFRTTKELSETYSFLWKYLELNDTDLTEKGSIFATKYESDVTKEICEEIIFLKSIHKSNIGAESLKPLQLLNSLQSLKLEKLFPNVCTAIRIFCTIPVSVAEAERSFSKLKIVKTFLRSTMGQDRLTGLSMLSIESELARSLNFEDIISEFALKKARKCLL